MSKCKFLFGIHCHQPVGNFANIFEEAYQKAYLPFLKVLESHPKVKFTAHYSGVLYDWFKAKHPEFIELLEKLVRRHQVEILSGGYYEPILSIIPDQDKLGQIETTNQFVKEEFGAAPQGLWLAERIWEPSLPKILSQAGIEYTIVDDNHFKLAGLSDEKLHGYYVTEDEGKILKVFPINKQLRDLIPFRPPEEVAEYFKNIDNTNGDAIAVFIDDGEKFGLRDGSAKYTYDEGYLDKLLTCLESVVEFTTFSDYLEEYPPQGRVYLPSASYTEMMEWSGGSFRNFLVKYPEANNMHKKMLQVSQRLHTLRKGKVLVGEEEQDKRLRQSIQNLYKGQCNCAYWTGEFAGLFSHHLRQAVYSNLIQAEVEMEKFSRGHKPFAELSVTDFDKDGNDEVILSNNFLNLYFSPTNGGSLFELDYKPRAVNLLNVLDRRALVDRFLSPEAELEASHDVGNFSGGAYSFLPKRSAGEVGLTLKRDGVVEGVPIRIEKNIAILSKQSIVSIEYKITNLGQEEDEFWFSSEFSLAVADKTLRSKGAIEKVKELKIVDEWSGFHVSLEMSKGTLLWHYPIENNGYQGAVLLPSWKFALKPEKSWKVRIVVRIEE
ncbi:alpha-amylase/4-alpha-glucanotransferase domain-containing protein [Candidatus Margulisiibacteriota bacterium]